MREIKFRAWDSKNKKMIYFDLSDTIAPSQDHIMQYTGLKDKNGIEIYEDDILDEVGKNWKVERDDGGAWMLDIDNGRGRKYLHPINQHLEIIGNIYDNPKLLEAK
jgi:uncharacterized phage protein (TIGR01671 family)